MRRLLMLLALVGLVAVAVELAAAVRKDVARYREISQM